MPTKMQIIDDDGSDPDTVTIQDCPFCGHTSCFCYSHHTGDGWYIACGSETCDARGPRRISALNAIGEWNRIAFAAKKAKKKVKKGGIRNCAVSRPHRVLHRLRADTIDQAVRRDQGHTDGTEL